MMRPLLSTLLVAATLGCHSATASPPQQAAQSQWLIGAFEGTLPCADCSGIRTVLLLYGGASPRAGDGIFVLREAYLGRAASERVVQGRWTTLRGNASNADATIYQLSPIPSGSTRYFLRANDDELRALDRRQEEMPPTAPHSLRRSGATPSLGGYAAIDRTTPEVQAAATFAVREHARQSGRPTTMHAVAYAEAQIVAGTNYKLCIDLHAKTGAARVLAIVYRDLRGDLSLTEWRADGCR